MNIVYKEWLPDQPALNNPGLIRAENVLPKDGGYSPFLPFSTLGGIASQNSISGSFMASGVTKGAARIYAFANTDFYVGGFSSVLATRGSATTGNLGESFAQYDNLVIAVSEGHAPLKHTVGATTSFTTLASSATAGTAPAAEAIGIVGQFVVLGNLGTMNATQRPNVIQWSGIDQPESWPTPNSATAIAQQSGEQELATIFGEVMAIHGGDQHGIVLQKSAVTRMTYIGPPAVFQFDTIERTQGCFFKGLSILVGGLTYFVSALGFCRTDGVTVERIGAGKVDRYFWDNVDGSKAGAGACSCAYDQVNELIYFAFPTSAASSAMTNRIMIYNPKTGQWTLAVQTLDELITSGNYVRTPPTGILAFANSGSNSVVGEFAATAGSAILETGEMEFNEAGRTYLDSWKPLVESTGTAPAITGRIGYRDDQQTAVSYTSTTSAFARTGVMNARVDAKYMRIETQIVGNFTKTTGVELDPQPSGMA